MSLRGNGDMSARTLVCTGAPIQDPRRAYKCALRRVGPWTRRSSVLAVFREEAPRLPVRSGRLADRAAGPEVAPAALVAGGGRERLVAALPRLHARGSCLDVGGDVLRTPDVVGQGPVGVL